jgi:hypothetical protein
MSGSVKRACAGHLHVRGLRVWSAASERASLQECGSNAVGPVASPRSYRDCCIEPAACAVHIGMELFQAGMRRFELCRPASVVRGAGRCRRTNGRASVAQRIAGRVEDALPALLLSGLISRA